MPAAPWPTAWPPPPGWAASTPCCASTRPTTCRRARNCCATRCALLRPVRPAGLHRPGAGPPGPQDAAAACRRPPVWRAAMPTWCRWPVSVRQLQAAGFVDVQAERAGRRGAGRLRALRAAAAPALGRGPGARLARGGHHGRADRALPRRRAGLRAVRRPPEPRGDRAAPGWQPQPRRHRGAPSAPRFPAAGCRPAHRSRRTTPAARLGVQRLQAQQRRWLRASTTGRSKRRGRSAGRAGSTLQGARSGTRRARRAAPAARH
jgi:hypothetical protein